MKITLNHLKFTKSLSYTTKAVSQKPNIPVLSNVLLEVNKNSIRLSATNLDMGINMWIPGVVEQEGKTTVSAKFLTDFVSVVNVDNVNIELKNDILHVDTQKSKANFNTIPAHEFPVLPKLSEKPMFKIQSKDLVDALEKVMFACSTDISGGKIQQTGVLFDVLPDSKINFVGVDGHRLSLKTASISDLDEQAKSEIIVPAKYLSEVVRIIQDNPDVSEVEVYLSETKSQIIFKIDQVELSIRLLEGPFPGYKAIMPTEFSFKFDIPTSDFDEAIKIANTFAKSIMGYKTIFDCDIENNIVSLKSNVAEIGENQTQFNVENADGPSDLNSSYNLKFLQDLANHISGNMIHFESQGPLSPSVFRDSGDKNFVHLIMPLRRDI